MAMQILMVLRTGNGYLPLACGDANGNGHTNGNGDGMPFTL